MGIATHSATRHCELRQTVHKIDANMSVAAGEAQKVDSMDRCMCDQTMSTPCICTTPPPCLSSRDPLRP